MKNEISNETAQFFGYSLKEIIDACVNTGTKIAITAAILIIGFWVVKRVIKKTRKVLAKRDMDEGLKTFLTSLINIGLKTLIVITAIGQLGIEMTSFIAILGAAGLAIGMAFSGTLSNFAGGVMVLVFKPYKVGDYVQIQGEEGVVKEIQIFNTILQTLGNKIIILPNGPVANGNITNFTSMDTRRVDFSFGFGYGEDFQLAKKTVLDVVLKDDRILADPAPFFGLGSMGDSSVNMTVRVWCKTEHYWDVHFDTNEKVYEAFEATEGLSIPYPQMDVHVNQVK
ncbi:MAG: mechanosensitive ion channel family protein [Lishizhenia sp.]